MSLFVRSKISISEKSAVRLIGQAFNEARNRETISRGDRQIILPRMARDLIAANPYSRILWGRSLCQEFSNFFRLDDSVRYPQVPLYWVTLVDLACWIPPDNYDADIAAFARRLRTGLNGLNYIAVIEPGYFVNLAAGIDYPFKRGICWHVHAICWGASQREMKARIKRLNSSKNNFRPIAKGLKGADQKLIDVDQLPKKFQYMLKTPSKSYRVSRTEWLTKRGDIKIKFKSKSSKLRLGERVTLFHHLKRHYIDQLTLAGGDGSKILSRAKIIASRD